MWVADRTVEACPCGRVFNFITRKHHCRLCGNIFCHSCTCYSIIPSFTNTKYVGKHRVCMPCKQQCMYIHGIETPIRLTALLLDWVPHGVQVNRQWTRAYREVVRVQKHCRVKMLHEHYSELEQTLLIRTTNIRRVLFGYPPPEVHLFGFLQLMNSHCAPRLLHHREWVGRQMQNIDNADIVLFLPWLHHVLPHLLQRSDDRRVAYALYFGYCGKTVHARSVRRFLDKGVHGAALRQTCAMVAAVERNIVCAEQVPPGRLPYNPDVVVRAVKEVTRFRSHSAPHALTLDTSDGEIQLLVKTTDVRKDRCTMVICKVLERMGIRCISYPVMVTPTGGWIQMLPAKTLYELGDSLSMHVFNQYPNTPPKVTRARFRRSVVGSCILSHLIGVGDRHLQNIVCHDAEIAHIDFSYMLGHDPKMPQPLRVTTPMIEMMGGKDSPCYQRFLVDTETAFRTVAQYGSLWCTLLENVAHEQLYDLVTVRQHVERQINTFPEDVVDIVKNHSDTWTHSITDFIHDIFQLKL